MISRRSVLALSFALSPIAPTAVLSAQSGSPPIAYTRADSIERVRVSAGTADSLVLDSLLALLTDASAPSDEVMLWQMRGDRLQVRLENRATALGVWRDCVRRFSTDRICLLGLGTGESWLGNFAASERAFAPLLELNADDVDALIGMGQISLWQNKAADARRFMLRARELSPTRIEPYLALSQLATKSADIAQADAWLRVAKSLDSKNVSVAAVADDAARRWRQQWILAGGASKFGDSDAQPELRAEVALRSNDLVHTYTAGITRSQFGFGGVGSIIVPALVGDTVWTGFAGLTWATPRGNMVSGLGYYTKGSFVEVVGLAMEGAVALQGSDSVPARTRLLWTVRPEWDIIRGRMSLIAGPGVQQLIGKKHSVSTSVLGMTPQTLDAAVLILAWWNTDWSKFVGTRFGAQQSLGRSREATTLIATGFWFPVPRVGLRVEATHRTGFAPRNALMFGLALRF